MKNQKTLAGREQISLLAHATRIRKIAMMLAILTLSKTATTFAAEKTITHFGTVYTLEEYLTVGPGRHYTNEQTRQLNIKTFNDQYEREQEKLARQNAKGSTASVMKQRTQ